MKRIKLPINSKFGKLTVKDYENHEGRWFHVCECDCGGITKAYSRELKTGKRKSCGKCNASIKDGHKYGMLTAVELVQIKNNRRHWKFKCECGNFVIRNGSKVNYREKLGIIQSCGCFRNKPKTYLRKKTGESAFNKVYGYYKYNAKRKDFDFKLTKDQAKNLMLQNCHYCNCQPSNILDGPNLNGPFIYNGIDRKNNNKGYTIDNVVTCCKKCNYKKQASNYKEFLDWIETIYNNRINPT